MKLATYHAPPETRGARSDRGFSPHARWAQFGDEVLVYGEETQWGALLEHARRGAVRMQERQPAVKREHLHVVVQNGRLFQQQHPEVPVILDRGRFLLVEIRPDQARQLEGKNITCYGVLPLQDNSVVFNLRRGAAVRPRAWVQNLVNRVSRPSLEADLAHLVSFPTRHSTSVQYASAAAWARSQLKTMGYRVRSQPITVNGGASRNVVADKQGSGAGTRNVVIVTAHLDSINLQGGPTATAPGADDNTSGSAGLLEMARVFQNHRGIHDLRLILFGGEEQGLFGSKRYVSSLAAPERARIRAVLNMDMIGSLNSPSRSVLLEGAALSQSMIDSLSEAAQTYTQLRVETSLHPFASDHVPFINAGIPAVLTIEGADNSNHTVHSANDTIDRISYDLTLEILRMNVAFVASHTSQAS